MEEELPSQAGTFQVLGVILAETLRQRGLGNIVLISQMLRAWPTIAGPMLVGVTRPDSIRGRVLFIAVCDSLWMQTLLFYQALLLTKIRQTLGDVPFTKLHFILARSSFRQPMPSQPTEALVSVPLTAAEEQHVEESTAVIADEELREAVRRAWKQGWQARRSGL